MKASHDHHHALVELVKCQANKTFAFGSAFFKNGSDVATPLYMRRQNLRGHRAGIVKMLALVMPSGEMRRRDALSCRALG